MSCVLRVAKQLSSWMKYTDLRRPNRMSFSPLSKREPLHCINRSYREKPKSRIGATTENPSFQITNALLSRCRVFVLAPLTTEHVKQILERAHHALCEDNRIPNIVSNGIIDYLADLADGDGNFLVLSGSKNSAKCTEHVRPGVFDGIHRLPEERVIHG